MLTSDRRLEPGPVVRMGRVARYRGLAEAAGEAHLVRNELRGPDLAEPRPLGRALLALAHLTDLHVTDVESPARFEYLNRFAGDPRFRELLSMQRPQEFLNAHAVDAMVRAVNAVGSAPLTGSPLDMVLMTGDAIDNTQHNEYATFTSLFQGGVVSPGSGSPAAECVQSPAWPDDLFWKPDGGARDHDRFRVDYGFPQAPGVLDRALAPFDAPGLRLPWLACRGNHEILCQGVGVVTPETATAMVGGWKAIAPPDGIDPDAALELFAVRPHVFMTGPGVTVSADAARRPASYAGPAHRVHDAGMVRVITLDTACPAGGADGSIDPAQLAWLEERLAEVHASYPDADGRAVRTGHEDRLVVIATHHPLASMTNRRAPDRFGGDELAAVLDRFRNVVLVLNGHIHINRVRPNARPGDASTGFWEVTTSSLVDWPCQGRVVELFDAGGGRLAISCTMLDHDGGDLAGLHRELAANDPLAGSRSYRSGTPADRNVILPLPAPFPL